MWHARLLALKVATQYSWGIDLGAGAGGVCVTDSCCVLSARRPEWVVHGLGRAFLYLSTYLSIYLHPYPHTIFHYRDRVPAGGPAARRLYRWQVSSRAQRRAPGDPRRCLARDPVLARAWRLHLELQHHLHRQHLFLLGILGDSGAIGLSNLARPPRWQLQSPREPCKPHTRLSTTADARPACVGRLRSSLPRLCQVSTGVVHAWVGQIVLHCNVFKT